MAPLPQNGTGRLWVDYTSVGRTHTMLFRFAPAVIANDAAIAAHQVCASLAPMMRSLDSFYAARFASEGQDVSFPAPWATVQGSGDNTGIPGDSESFYIDFIGRGVPSGRRVHYTFFTGSAALPVPGNNRFQPGQNALVDAAVTTFQNAASTTEAEDPLQTIAADSPLIYGYVNAGYNGHWQRKQRRGG